GATFSGNRPSAGDERYRRRRNSSRIIRRNLWHLQRRKADVAHPRAGPGRNRAAVSEAATTRPEVPRHRQISRGTSRTDGWPLDRRPVPPPSGGVPRGSRERLVHGRDAGARLARHPRTVRRSAGRPDPRRALRHRQAFYTPGKNGLPDRRRGPVPGVRLARGRTRPPRGRGRSRDVPHRRPPASHGNGPRDRRTVRRGPQPLDIPRLLRRRDRRPDPPGVREACAPRRNPGHLHREPGLRRPAFRPARLRDLRGHRSHRTTTPGSRDLTNAERMAVLPPKRRGSGSYPDRAHRTLYLQPPRVAPPPPAGRVASDGGVRRV